MAAKLRVRLRLAASSASTCKQRTSPSGVGSNSSSIAVHPGSQICEEPYRPWHEDASENHETVSAPPTLGILAGGGPFPGRVAAAAQAAGRRVFVVALRGYADAAVRGAFPH